MVFIIDCRSFTWIVPLGGPLADPREGARFRRQVLEGLKTHRSALQASLIQVPVVAGSVLLLHALGVDPTAALYGVLAILGYKTLKDGRKE